MATMRIALAGRLNSRTIARDDLECRELEAAEQERPSEFAALYSQYFPKVFAYVYGRVQDKELSLDIVSDVFEKAFVKKDSLRSSVAFGSWLFTIARNEGSSYW